MPAKDDQRQRHCEHDQPIGNLDCSSWRAGNGLSISANIPSATDSGSAQNIFKNIIVSGQPTITAGQNNDSLTVVQGSGIILTTDLTTKQLTIAASGSALSQWISNGTSIYYNGGNVGIGTAAPTQALDVTGNVRFSGALMPNNLAGTTGQVLTSAGAGVAPTWGSAATIGDVKYGLQAGDHTGWIKLDGRLKTALTATQQTAATGLGIATNIPDATNRMLTQTGTLLATGGSNTTTIAQTNLCST